MLILHTTLWPPNTSERSAILFWVSSLGDEEKFLQQKNYKKGYFCIQSWLPRFFSRMSRKKPPKLALVKPIHKLWSPCLYGQLKKVCFHPNPRDWTIEVSSLETNKLDFSKSFSFSNSSLLSQDMTRWGWTRREGSNVMPFCRRQSSHTCFFFFSVERSLKSKPPGPYVPTKIFQIKLRAKSAW